MYCTYNSDIKDSKQMTFALLVSKPQGPARPKSYVIETTANH